MPSARPSADTVSPPWPPPSSHLCPLYNTYWIGCHRLAANRELHHGSSADLYMKKRCGSEFLCGICASCPFPNLIHSSRPPCRCGSDSWRSAVPEGRLRPHHAPRGAQLHSPSNSLHTYNNILICCISFIRSESLAILWGTEHQTFCPVP